MIAEEGEADVRSIEVWLCGDRKESEGLRCFWEGGVAESVAKRGIVTLGGGGWGGGRGLEGPVKAVARRTDGTLFDRTKG